MKSPMFSYQYICKGARLLLMAACLVTAACSDDSDRPVYSSRIGFVPSMQNSWSPATIACTEDTAATRTDSIIAVREGGTGTPFYLHTVVSNNIEGIPPQETDGEGTVTRAVPVSDSTMYATFRVSAYVYARDDTWNGSQLPNYMYDIAFDRNGTVWQPASVYYWPGADYYIRFFAYAPKNTAYVFSENTRPGPPVIKCTIPADVSEQDDLLVAGSGELSGNLNTDFPLVFKHALTAIRFVCGTDMGTGTIRSISLKNVYGKGTYHMESTDWMPESNSLITFTQTLNKSTTGTTGEALTVAAQTFMMIPQTLPQNAQIEIRFYDGTTDHTLTADIGGNIWPTGRTVTYRISTSSINWSYHLSVTPPGEFRYSGGSDSYKVTSYKRSSSGNTQPVAWQAEFSTDGGKSWSHTKPAWLTAFTDQAAGSTIANQYTATVSAQVGNSTNPYVLKLRSAAPRGSAENPYNLSNSMGGSEIQNTANCYIVSAPGTYSLPLVYGNAITDGRENPSAYRSALTTGNNLTAFVNHTGAAISDPYIPNNRNCTPGSCELLWQDAPDLVSDVRLSPDNSLVFTVNQFTIQEGNAVVAVRSTDNLIMWSWHIWVTDESRTEVVEIKNRRNQTYAIMPVNLGWCEGDTVNYAERSCLVRITAGNQMQQFIIRQNAATITTGANCTFYEWGRKDPLLPSNGQKSGTATKTWYDTSGKARTDNPTLKRFGKATACITSGILEPAVMNKNGYMDNAYMNLWNANGKKVVVKTVYDPSPAGFHIPEIDTFTGFGTNCNINAKGTFNDGWYFYCAPNKQGNTIFFPAVGYRGHFVSGTTATSGMMCVGTIGHTWLTPPLNLNNGRFLYFDNTKVIPISYNVRAYGIAVRPVRETD